LTEAPNNTSPQSNSDLDTLLKGVPVKTEIKSYNIKSFIRKNVSGELDLDESMTLAKQFSTIASLHSDHNILIDMRDTTVPSVKIADLMKLTLEIADHIPDFKNKIANVIPKDEERMLMARQFHSCMVLKGFSYEVFTDFEKALEWLSETSVSY
jgi:hypothetical protein